jgi:single-stranded-DNA-specific exonuclease
MIKERIKIAVERIDSLSKEKPIKIVSHFDADGITSAAIFCRAMQRWGKEFSVDIVKNLDENIILQLSDKNILIFLDLASGSLDYLAKKNTEVFVFDHHEIVQEIPSNVFMINPVLEKEEPMSAAAVCYLFAKQLSSANVDLASLGVIGMVGDLQEKEIGKIFGEILRDSDAIVKRGLLIYPSTRPLNRVLEYSSSPYLPGVTGSREGANSLLRETGLIGENGQCKALYELNDEEMMKLVTGVMLRGAKAGATNQEGLLGNLFLMKFFNKLEDAREISALINACSRMDRRDVALGFCLGNRMMKEEAEKIYLSYKQSLLSALKYVSETEKVEGKDYLIIHGRDVVKDTIIGTVASILSHSPLYPEGLMVIALAYDQEKIKVSARMTGKKGRNVRDVLNRAVVPIGGEVGGHPNAAGCLIPREREIEFMSELRKVLDLEVVRV